MDGARMPIPERIEQLELQLRVEHLNNEPKEHQEIF
jgi:hypothetical protein